jgi:hypothetical protein
MFRFAHFFIDRPIFATVLSVLLTIAGAITLRTLPIAEYPEIAPPTVTITANYPGASAEVVASTVAAPIEQEVNGVDDMLYISSQSTGDGRVTINVVFKAGTDVDQAQVLVQNRVSAAVPRLPQEVRARPAGPQGLAGLPDGHPHAVAGWLARPAIRLELHDTQRQGRADPRRGRRRRAGVRCARLFDARLARSGQGRGPQPDRRRRRRRDPRR